MNKGENLKFMSNSPADTAALGCRLGRLLGPGDIVCLEGGLGAGKTCLARGIAKGLGVDETSVSSPTFVLAQEYRGRVRVYHLDLYRLSSSDEVDEAGLDEYIWGDGVAIIEWPGVYVPLREHDRLMVEITQEPVSLRRELVLTPYGQRYRQLLEEMRPC
ncbi:MAG: tRNA (adenosine(37)-N6)-threonylcarbamoyltransferase complex ATPase subunit type 1 TsaE [Bacillota bacterium]|jgi:tRNA threonylcarbamoyladenosine biosynthesis protein TsaE|nr:tRNA (adenosine(37)-N6)-threonylcarbamoyltransferase complex ATPase subunit type 1 TsaE [Bacillota bacterium]HOL52298.1 tRNA (adenosine(37)-N6)-threonylcarbamoyltransferase complex ATPase subunit type 1 TsaE [Bacillota bacterium]